MDENDKEREDIINKLIEAGISSRITGGKGFRLNSDFKLSSETYSREYYNGKTIKDLRYLYKYSGGK